MVLNAMIMKKPATTGGIASTSIKAIWELSGEKSALRRLITDFATIVCTHDWLETELELPLPYGLLVEIAKAHSNPEKRPPPIWETRCTYHVHPEGTKRCE